ncbi:MAG: cysteine--tRNA ligase [Culicoidibacterales bacterium]
MKLYNSLTKQVEDVVPMNEKEISMYVCGPTVYNYVHIGNARPPLVFDFLNRGYTWLGYEVKHFSNITDIDDKIIAKAIQAEMSEKEISDFYKNAYNEDLRALNIKPLSGQPTVVESMDKIIAFIADLIERGYAYVSEDKTVYFDTSKVNEYSLYVGQNLDELAVGQRIALEAGKRGHYDFVLWKPTQEGIKFDAPWGEGRPGWHTECVVMIEDNFQGMIDIHGGGGDLRFPHHSNEMVQSKALHDHHLANVWVHTGMIQINQEKMSKSLGNFILLRDFLKVYSSDVIRYWMYNTSYRSTLDYTEEILLSSQKSIDKLWLAYDTALLQASEIIVSVPIEEPLAYLETLKMEMKSYIEGDLNTANMISLLSKLTKYFNDEVSRLEGLRLFKTVAEILGFMFVDKQIDETIHELLEKRERARKEKDFELADNIKKQLLEKKIKIR